MSAPIIEVFPDEPSSARARYWERQAAEKDALIASQAAEIEGLKTELHQWEESDAASSVLHPIFTEEIDRQAALIQSMREALEKICTALFDARIGEAGMVAHAALAQLSTSPKDPA